MSDKDRDLSVAGELLEVLCRSGRDFMTLSAMRKG